MVKTENKQAHNPSIGNLSCKECPAVVPDTLFIKSGQSHGIAPTLSKCDFVLDEDDHGEFCVIPLRGKGGFFAKIDPEDFADISKFKWFGVYNKNQKSNPAYAARNRTKEEIGNGLGFREKMHRRVMKVKDGTKLDHERGDGLDNRKGNLRVATQFQNMFNKRRQSNSKSKYKGPVWCAREGKWSVSIQYMGKRTWLGYFKVEIKDGVDVGEVEAAKRYDKEAIKLFGSFARLNFPEEQKMSYIIDKKVKRKVEKSISDIRKQGLTGGEMSEILANKSVQELEDMCKVLECNISRLSTEIRRSTGNHVGLPLQA